jgi:type II secretory pathway component PulK
MRASEKKIHQDTSGIALFMVIAAISILSIMVTEFTYISQINQKIAFDALDQVKAHYLAKSGLKLSLLRLKAFAKVKDTLAATTGGAGAPGIPRQILDKIWSFPFMYPIPTAIPGLSQTDKDAISKFQTESSLEGSFTAVIESESARYNLNSLLAGYVGSTTVTSTTGGRGGGATTSSTTTTVPANGPLGPNANNAQQFDPEQGRQALQDYLFNTFQRKSETDPDFSDFYRGFQLQDLVESIAAWSDRYFERRNRGFEEKVPYKRAPFYSITELHMVPGMDDTLYDLFAPTLTVTTTPGININTMQEPILRALIPGLTDEEVKDFFKFRDDEQADNQFKTAADFWKYAQQAFSRFRNDPAEVRRYEEELTKRNIRLVTEETQFRIVVQATVNQSTRLIEAQVAVTPPPTNPTGAPNVPNLPGMPPIAQPPGVGNPNNPMAPAIPGQVGPPRVDPGLRITFMRVL